MNFFFTDPHPGGLGLSRPGSFFGLPSGMMDDIRRELRVRSVSNMKSLAASMRSSAAVAPRRHRPPANRPITRPRSQAGPGKIFGTCCHYLEFNDRQSGPEPFMLAPGCFSASLYQVPLVLHDHRGPTVIDALSFVDTPTGLTINGSIPGNAYGFELLEQLEAAGLDGLGLSIKASPIETVTEYTADGVPYNHVLFASLEHVAVLTGDNRPGDAHARCWLFN